MIYLEIVEMLIFITFYANHFILLFQVAVIMKVTLPESYPDELPELELTPEMGVTESECESLTNELLSLVCKSFHNDH